MANPFVDNMDLFTRPYNLISETLITDYWTQQTLFLEASNKGRVSLIQQCEDLDFGQIIIWIRESYGLHTRNKQIPV